MDACASALYIQREPIPLRETYRKPVTNIRAHLAEPRTALYIGQPIAHLSLVASGNCGSANAVSGIRPRRSPTGRENAPLALTPDSAALHPGLLSPAPYGSGERLAGPVFMAGSKMIPRTLVRPLVRALRCAPTGRKISWACVPRIASAAADSIRGCFRLLPTGAESNWQAPFSCLVVSRRIMDSYCLLDTRRLAEPLISALVGSGGGEWGVRNPGS